VVVVLPVDHGAPTLLFNNVNGAGNGIKIWRATYTGGYCWIDGARSLGRRRSVVSREHQHVDPALSRDVFRLPGSRYGPQSQCHGEFRRLQR
jgi:hypothetical protein